jgi:hypothetical protein
LGPSALGGDTIRAFNGFMESGAQRVIDLVGGTEILTADDCQALLHQGQVGRVAVAVRGQIGEPDTPAQVAWSGQKLYRVRITPSRITGRRVRARRTG